MSGGEPPFPTRETFKLESEALNLQHLAGLEGWFTLAVV
jgi:hypothetical protein